VSTLSPIRLNGWSFLLVFQLISLCQCSDMGVQSTLSPRAQQISFLLFSYFIQLGQCSDMGVHPVSYSSTGVISTVDLNNTIVTTGSTGGRFYFFPINTIVTMFRYGCPPCHPALRSTARQRRASSGWSDCDPDRPVHLSPGGKELLPERTFYDEDFCRRFCSGRTNLPTVEEAFAEAE
jgi:hypothetical protein